MWVGWRAALRRPAGQHRAGPSRPTNHYQPTSHLALGAAGGAHQQPIPEGEGGGEARSALRRRRRRGHRGARRLGGRGCLGWERCPGLGSGARPAGGRPAAAPQAVAFGVRAASSPSPTVHAQTLTPLAHARPGGGREPPPPRAPPPPPPTPTPMPAPRRAAGAALALVALAAVATVVGAIEAECSACQAVAVRGVGDWQGDGCSGGVCGGGRPARPRRRPPAIAPPTTSPLPQAALDARLDAERPRNAVDLRGRLGPGAGQRQGVVVAYASSDQRVDELLGGLCDALGVGLVVPAGVGEVGGGVEGSGGVAEGGGVEEGGVAGKGGAAEDGGKEAGQPLSPPEPLHPLWAPSDAPPPPGYARPGPAEAETHATAITNHCHALLDEAEEALAAGLKAGGRPDVGALLCGGVPGCGGSAVRSGGGRDEL